MVRVRKSLVGEKFGRLTVVEQAEDYVKPNGEHYSRWRCVCDCPENNEVVVTGSHLKSGDVKSCGCLAKDVATSRGKRNRIDICEDYCVGYTNGTNVAFYFDISDLDVVCQYTWWADFRKKYNTTYIKTTIHEAGKKKHIYLHKLLTSNELTDHIDRNPLNNRRSNLRVADDTQNNRNASIAKNNTSGVTGVVWVKHNQKWGAQIMVNYQSINLGYYINKDDAIKARLEAEQKYFGEFAPQKNLYDEYGITE